MFNPNARLAAQTWLADGQAWQYEVFGGFDFEEWGIHELKVVGDTTIQGVDFKKVVHFPLASAPHTWIAKEAGDAVFVYEPSDGSIVKIYDFSLLPGDTVHLVGERKYVISDTGSLLINGFVRRYQEINLGSGILSGYPFLVVEGLGMVGDPAQENPPQCSYFFLHHDFCGSAWDGWDIGFRCFSSGEIFYDPFGECSLSQTGQVHQDGLKIFPNPVSSQLTVEVPGGIPITDGYLYDLQGRLAWSGKPVGAGFSLENVKAGMYFLKIHFENGGRGVAKIIVL